MILLLMLCVAIGLGTITKNYPDCPCCQTFNGACCIHRAMPDTLTGLYVVDGCSDIGGGYSQAMTLHRVGTVDYTDAQCVIIYKSDVITMTCSGCADDTNIYQWNVCFSCIDGVLVYRWSVQSGGNITSVSDVCVRDWTTAGISPIFLQYVSSLGDYELNTCGGVCGGLSINNDCTLTFTVHE